MAMNTDRANQHKITPHKKAKVVLNIPLSNINPESLTISGKPTKIELKEALFRSKCTVQIPYAGEKEKVVLTYRDLDKLKLNYSGYAATNERYTVNPTNGKIVDIDNPQGVLKDASIKADSLSGIVTGSKGDHTFFVKLAQGSISFWLPVNVKISDPITAEIRLNKENNELIYAEELTNNTEYKLEGTISNNILGQTDTEQVSIGPHSTITTTHSLSEATIRKITPGKNPVKIVFKGNQKYSFTGEITEYNLFKKYNLQSDYFLKGVPTISMPELFNDRLDNLFKHEYTKCSVPTYDGIGLYDGRYPTDDVQIREPGPLQWGFYGKNNNNGSNGFDQRHTWKVDKLDDKYIRDKVINGVYTTGAGVPFSQVKEGNNTAFISLWENFPAEITVGDINQKARKIYLLLGGTCVTNNTYMPSAEIGVIYTDGGKEKVELIHPINYDCIVREPFAQEGIMEILGPDCHINILDIITNPERTISSIQVHCSAIETIVGIMGITLVTP